MSDKIREFYELIHSMNHGDLRRIARAITEQIEERSKDFDASDYRDFCDVLFDCASQEMGEEDFGGDMPEPLEPAEELPSRNYAEPDTGPVSAFARKGA
ncbi:MAG: hypothetical protein ACLFV8_08395 [Alphaproteobacteria bacterium]